MGRGMWRNKTALLIAVAVFAAGVGVIAYATQVLGRTELQTIDARFSIRGTARGTQEHRARADRQHDLPGTH